MAHRIMNALGAMIPETSTQGEDPVARLCSLAEALEGSPRVASRVTEFSKYIYMDTLTQFKNIRNDEDVKDLVSAMVLRAMIHGLCDNPARASLPKLHHWVPVCYMRRFRGNKTSNGGNKYTLKAKISVANRPMAFSVFDRQFAHPVINDQGYNDHRVEAFYSMIEGLYSSTFTKEHQEVFSRVAVSSFAIIQSVRSPHPSNGFIPGDVASVFGATLAMLDRWDHIYASPYHSDVPVAFLPYVPARVHQYADGSQSICFPVEVTTQFVLSSAPISDAQVENMVGRHMDLIASELSAGRMECDGVRKYHSETHPTCKKCDDGAVGQRGSSL